MKQFDYMGSSMPKFLPLSLLLIFVVFCLVDLDNLGVYPDELVDTQNAIALIRQDRMETQIIEYNQIKLGGIQLPIYGIKPYNGAGLSYVMALGFAILGISITSLKLITILLMSLALVFLYQFFCSIVNPYLALVFVILFGWSPYYIHFTRFDHGPLRAIFLLFCMFMFLWGRNIYGKLLGERDKLVWAAITGFGLFNHIIFILPIIALGISLLILPEQRRIVVPRRKYLILAIVIFLLMMTPFLLDLPGFVQEFSNLFSAVISNQKVANAGGREIYSESNIIKEIIGRFQRFIWQKDNVAIGFEYSGYSQSLPYPYPWGLFTIGTLGIGLVLYFSALFRRTKISTFSKQDIAVIVAAFTIFSLGLTLPLIASLHHQIYTQISMMLISMIVIDRVLRRLQTNLKSITLLAMSVSAVISISLSTLMVWNYSALARNQEPMGLFSPSIKDMEYIIDTEYRDYSLVTYGWGIHSYVALLFGGERKATIYVSPQQITEKTALFVSLTPDQKIKTLKANPQDITIQEFAEELNLQVAQITKSSDKGGYSPFAIITFKQLPLSQDYVKKSIDQIATVIDEIKLWKLNGHDYGLLSNKRAIADGLIPPEVVADENNIHLPWGNALIEPLQNGSSFSILFSNVANQHCVQLWKYGVEKMIIYTGYFGKTPINEDEARSFCTTGNIWLLPK